MPLEVGARLGAYEVIAAIGAGGMGEVYRARDTRLDRDVAIKVLPPHLAQDDAARARFEREAKAIAALSHPNILAVYEFGSADAIAFVVMELLEGETLRERLTASGGSTAALPIRKVTQIGIEIAQGLAAAHEKQIVHRDLKPENVFLSADGRVKILDFGLAKAIDRDSSGAAAAATNAATQLQRTEPGMVMGTVGYMSPEQVKGLAADHRADIFSLGCVLYEMASGRRAFVRETAAETMTAILRDDPPDLVRESGAVPAAFEPIVRHCLEKRPEERFQSARDLAFALQSLSSSAVSGGAAAMPTPANDRRRRVPIGVALALAGAAAMFFAGRYTGSPSTPTAPHVTEFQQVSDFPGVETSPTLSPDGKTVVYASDATGNWQLYSLRVGGRSAVALTTGSADSTPAFSPDGERVAFRSERDGGGIFLMTATGESVTRVSDEGYSPAWSPDGGELVFARAGFVSPTDIGGSATGLLVIDVKSGQKREVLKAGSALQPAWSPHGWRVAYFGLRPGTGQRDLWTVAADGTEVDAARVEVTSDAALDWSPTWSPQGDYLYFSSNRGGTMNLWRVAIDERSGRPAGEPEPVTTPSGWSGALSFSRDGSHIAFASLDWRSTMFRQGFDPVRETLVGTPIPMLKGSRPIRDHDISPDGRWIAFNETGAREDLFVARADGSEYRRLTDDAARDRGPTWSPDGTRLVFYSDRGGKYDLWTIRPDGSRIDQVTSGSNTNFPTWSPDGARIATGGVNAEGLYLIDSASKAVAPPQKEPQFTADATIWPFSWSPDGHLLLGPAIDRTGSAVALVTYDVGSKAYRRIPLALGGGWVLPAWLGDSRRLLLRTSDGISVVDSQTGVTKRLISVRGYVTGRSLSVARDNTWFSYTETGTESDIWVAVFKDKKTR